VDDQYKILTAFGKVNSEENKKLNATGVGLGLLISNMIVKNLNKTD
jgi:K+-sensing histidine kinase KdpD